MAAADRHAASNRALEAAKHAEASEPRHIAITAYCAGCHHVVEIEVHQGRAYCTECERSWRWSGRIR